MVFVMSFRMPVACELKPDIYLYTDANSMPLDVLELTCLKISKDQCLHLLSTISIINLGNQGIIETRYKQLNRID